ncbi:MAG: acyltransferase family protein, partial [Acidimicrobiales bacterium]
GASPGFLPEVQGLRALAVSLVVLFHLWPERVTGGYVGVDVFFVISGFLISGHLLREVGSTGHVGLAAFWARRIRRLLPAAMLVLLATVVGIVLWVPRALWPQFLEEVGASTLYVQNWVLAANSVDYFASENAPSPVQHYWSLSVEEQFYLVWPLLVAGALVLHRLLRGRDPVRAIGTAMAVVFVASLAYSVVATAHLQAFAYFSSPAHAWELAAGGLLAVVYRPLTTRLSAFVAPRAALSWLGLGAIVVAALTYTGSSPFPGWIALLPVAGTVAVIAAGSPACWWAPSGLVARRPVQFIGDTSYSLYLWHWPVIVLTAYAIEDDLRWPLKLVLLAVSVTLGGLTKAFVEDPARDAAWLRPRPARSYAVAGLATVLLLGVVGVGREVAERDRRRLEAAAAQRLEDAQANADPCFGAAAADAPPGTCTGDGAPTVLVPDPSVAADDGPTEYEACRVSHNQADFRVCQIVEPAAPVGRMALIGDSHAEQWLPALERIAQERGWALDTYLKGGCPVSAVMRTDDATRGAHTCAGWNERLAEVLADERYDVLVTSAVAGKPVERSDDRSNLETSVDGLVTKWEELATSGAEIVAIRDNPWPGFDVPLCLDRAAPTPAEFDSVCTVARAEALLDDAQVEATRRLDRPLVDVTHRLCDDERCRTVVGGVVAYRDGDHLTKTFVLTLVPDIDAVLAPALERALR